MRVNALTPHFIIHDNKFKLSRGRMYVFRMYNMGLNYFVLSLNLRKNVGEFLYLISLSLTH